MPFVRITDYRDIPFSKETPCEFYSYLTISELLSKCIIPGENITKIRTIGVLYSECGHFFLKNMPKKSTDESHKINVSVSYLPSAPASTVVPYVVQVFGDLQCKRVPVVVARTMSALHPAAALQLHNSMTRIKTLHLAHSVMPACDNSL